MSKGENESTVPSPHVNPSLPLQFNKKNIKNKMEATQQYIETNII